MSEDIKNNLKRKFAQLVDKNDFTALQDLVALIEEAAEEIVKHG